MSGSTGQVVGGILGAVVGAVVGYYTGDYQAIAYGYAIGSGAGGLIDPPHIYGPKLDDLKIQQSSYGADITQNWGAVRQAGNIIWQTDLIRRDVNTSSKGGTASTTYKYTFNTAVGLCCGPIIGIGRIWANKKVWYDDRPSNPGAARDPRIGEVRIYLGDESQIADPLIESISGPGTPGYRGLAYVVLEGVDGTDTQGRIQWEFEVFVSGSTSVLYTNVCSLSVNNLGDTATRGRAWITDRKIYWWRTTGGVAAPIAYFRSVDGQEAQFVSYKTVGNNNEVIPVNTRDWFCTANAFTRNASLLDGGITHQCLNIAFPENSHPPRTIFNHVVFSTYTALTGNNILVAYDQDSDVTVVSIREYRGSIPKYFAERIVLATGGMPIYNGIPLQVSAYNDSIVGQHVLGTPAEIVCALAAANGKVFAMIYDGANMRLRILSQIGGSVMNDYIGPAIGPLLGATDVQESIRTDGTKVWAWCGNGGLVWRWNPNGTYTVLANGIGVQTDAGVVTTALGGNQVYIDDNSMLNLGQSFLNSDGVNQIFRIERVVFAAPAVATVPLSQIVSDLCLASDLQASDIDVSQLTDIVSGYSRPRRMTGRAAIEPLQQAYFFDAVESDFKLKFVKRAGAIATTIPLDDRAAHEDGQPLPDHLKIVRLNELELPNLVDVDYIDATADYLVGNQYEVRLTKKVKTNVDLKLPLLLSTNQAKRIAATSLYSAWLTQTYSFTTSRKYAQFEPTDVVSLPTNAGTYTARITRKVDMPSGVIQWEAIQEDAAVYTQTLVGTPLNYTPTTLNLPARTQLNMMDIPILQDSDDSFGAYAKLTPLGTNWQGATLTKNDQQSPMLMGSVAVASVAGITLTALPEYAGIESFDESNCVDVQVPAGTLVSVTRDQALAGANTFLIGGGVAGSEEIVTARDISLIAANRYRLSGLLRHQKGTRGDLHAQSDRAVQMELAGLIRFDNGSNDLNVSHRYSAITFGRSFDSSEQTPFSNTGIGMQPLPPIHLGTGQVSVNSVFQWTRQTRLQATLRDRVDAPLGETVEQYQLQIADTAAFATIRQTFVVNAPSATYTGAQRNADVAAGMPLPFYWRVAQWSSRYGYGAWSRPNSFVPQFVGVGLIFALGTTGTNGSTVFGDLSPYGATITHANLVSASPVNIQSNKAFFPIALDDYIGCTNDVAFNVGAHDFVYSITFNTTSTRTNATLLARGFGAANVGSFSIQMNESAIDGRISYYNADFNGYSAAMMKSPAGTNYCNGVDHVLQIVRIGSSWSMIVDGTTVATATYASAMGSLTGRALCMGENDIYTGRRLTGTISLVTLTTS